MNKNELALYKSAITNTEIDITSKEITALLPTDKKNSKFAMAVINEIKSEEFISELDDKIGSIKNNESQEEFIARGKIIVRNMLYKKFKL
ncbi:TPA: hypothetical protein ACKFTV_002211 [Klebsiella pneumoniae]|uniref:hypothetical protein n=1 Tax=Klebsiella TaxID=570 RepID=UPI000C79CE35|nr:MULTISPECIES: hypothetical protein [Klebsiella]HCA9839084.1 hypothetical protein [Klebsiella variicola subsp. variicola]EJD6390232.1 hypothetical protein [Klebsiella pneumoniae]MCP2565372.1 hypothetical protein [Klebsiella pneumoniae]MCQ0997616.1 hypothetical protein [Klebsiella pneumoniae]MCQ1002364.1 hypothetical protein [Klebsiella pneumoniae]